MLNEMRLFIIFLYNIRLQLKWIDQYTSLIMIKVVSNLASIRIGYSRHFLYAMSAFKNKFQLLQSTEYQNVGELYKRMNEFERSLEYQQKLKYNKSGEGLQNKIKKIQKKQKQRQSPYQTNSSFSEPFQTSISYRIFYGLENKLYQIFNNSKMANIIPLSHLYQMTTDESMFAKNFDMVWQKLLSNPQENQQLYEVVQQRCNYLQQQLSLNIFQQYIKILKQAEQSKLLEKESKQKLKSLKGIKPSEAIFTKDFKFELKEQVTQEEHMKASSIAKILTKYGFGSEKLMMFSLRVVSKQNNWYKSLTPQSLQNHLFILAFHKQQTSNINDNIYKIFDMFVKHEVKSKYRQEHGQIGPLNSLLFYMLSNKIQNYELYKSIIQQLNIRSTNTDHNTNNKSKIKSICTFDRQLFCLMMRLLEVKFQIIPTFSIRQIYKDLPTVSSNSNKDFQLFLDRKNYKYSLLKDDKNEVLKIIKQPIYEIDDKKFICLNLVRMNNKTQKTNGIGDIIMQIFKVLGQQFKLINPIVLQKCQKRVQKQQYFKSKLKGVKQPQSTRQRRFDF